MSPSSNEEIGTQHAEAIQMVELDLPCAQRQELGPISLADKEQPTCLVVEKAAAAAAAAEEEKKGEEKKEREESSMSLQNSVCFTTRGVLDVTPLQDLAREGFNTCRTAPSPEDEAASPTNYWDPRNAAKHNITITRPSHDAWGIGKIVLLFCDDFAARIFQMPWWKDFQPALQPILDTCLPPNSNATLIRVLLASLPPGVTIPVHHDTGEWVKTTHRVHVPILVNDPSKILFRCGPTPETMQRIDCEPGHVFEINNQAKHAVSNCDSDSRVHLILDYMDTPGPERIVLEPGEQLVQTRRSIDRLKDMAERPCPSYIILGAQKAGTTSLYDYINQHPWVVPARRRETHCLDWRWNDDLTISTEHVKHCRTFFFAEELQQHPSCLTGDSTPSYLLDSRRVIPRLRQVFPWKMKLFCMLRDPVKRAISHYAMVTSRQGTPAQLKTRGSEWRHMSFRKVVEKELNTLDDCGLIPYFDKTTGRVNTEVFETFSGSSEEKEAWDRYLTDYIPLSTGSYGLLTRGMYALQLQPWFKAFDKDQFLILRLESMRERGVQEFMRPVWEHLDLPNHPVEDETAKNTRGYRPLGKDIQQYLERFFAPHNRRIAAVLGTEAPVEWIDPWPYQQRQK